jgi:archaemetzincin
MKIGLLPVEQVNHSFLSKICQELTKIFTNSTCTVIGESLKVSEKAYDKERGQYNSNVILGQIQLFSEAQGTFQRVLGVADVDLFVPELNFVFGEAYTLGATGLISLFRLKPEFYGQTPDEKVFLERTLKEAVHEIGHTLGLGHCPNSSCVMHFSNSIADTDKKQSLFCKQCFLQAATTIHTVG